MSTQATVAPAAPSRSALPRPCPARWGMNPAPTTIARAPSSPISIILTSLPRAFVGRLEGAAGRLVHVASGELVTGRPGEDLLVGETDPVGQRLQGAGIALAQPGDVPAQHLRCLLDRDAGLAQGRLQVVERQGSWRGGPRALVMREVHAQHHLVDADLASSPYLGEREDRGAQVTLACEVLRGLHPDDVTDVLPRPTAVQDVVHRSQLRDHPIRAHLGEDDLEVRVALKDSAPDELEIGRA